MGRGARWTTWVAATSVVVGAVTGDRLAGAPTGGWFVRISWRLVTALAATLGALVTIPLVAVPARGAQIVDNYAPHLLAGVYAAIGVVLGLVVALIALTARAVATNVLTTASWLWVLAMIAITDGAASVRGPGYAELGVWKFTSQGPTWHSFYIPGALLMLGSALLIGGLAAFPSAGRGASRLAVAISGAAGPAMVAAAYVLAGQSSGPVPFEQNSAYATAPFMVVAGLAGSVLVAAIGGAPSKLRATDTGADGNKPATFPTQSSSGALTSEPATAWTQEGVYHSQTSFGYHDLGYQDVGYQDPGYHDPGYHDPGYHDPGYHDLGYHNPGADPGR